MARARIAALFAALFAGAALLASALADETAGRTPLPTIPKGKGDHCVRDTDFMRRYHMTMLKRQRDETVHEGVRGGDFSIRGCVNCHVVDGPDGQPVGYDNPKHFCRSCHDYESVSIDCFECHASKPDSAAVKASFADPRANRDVAALNDYLREALP